MGYKSLLPVCDQLFSWYIDCKNHVCMYLFFIDLAYIDNKAQVLLDINQVYFLFKYTSAIYSHLLHCTPFCMKFQLQKRESMRTVSVVYFGLPNLQMSMEGETSTSRIYYSDDSDGSHQKSCNRSRLQVRSLSTGKVF